MELNRTFAPELRIPGKINILQPGEIRLDNGLSAYVINSGNENVVKLEIVFPSSVSDGISHLISMACHQLADSGTKSRKAIEIAEEFDFFGAFFQSDAGPDHKSFSLYTLGPLFDDSVKILHEILHDAVFPESEISNWKKRQIQSHSVNKEKVSWHAKKSFNSLIYGNTHVYGYTPEDQDYEYVNAEEINSHYRKNYSFENAIIILSGKITDKIISTVNTVFGQIRLDHNLKNSLVVSEPGASTATKFKISKPDSVQSAIRIGRQLFSKSHPDFLPLQIANTVLGGYFGSRLMSNIREDKGYTYGIGSGLQSHIRSGSFFIATEVGRDVCENAVHEIYKEMQKLTEEPIPENELKIVRNYLSGSFLRSIDGPFELAERFKGIKLYNLDYNYFDKYLHLLNNITPEQVQEVASKYLQPANMTEVIAG